MRQTPPHALTFISSTAPGSTYSEWDAATDYTTGQQVKVSPGATITAAGETSNTARTIQITGVSPSPVYLLAGTVFDILVVDAGSTPVQPYSLVVLADGSKVQLSDGSWLAVTGDGEASRGTTARYVSKIRDTLATATKNLAQALTLAGYPSTHTDTAVKITNGAGTYPIEFYTTAPVSEFEAVQASTGKPPVTSSEYWVRKGVSNEYKMLDTYVSSKTEGIGGFTISVSVPYRFDKIYLFSLEGAVSARIKISYRGEQVYDETHGIALVRNIATWWDFFFSPIEYGTSTDLSVPGVWYPATVEITLNGNTDAMVKCGMLVVGSSIYLGATQWDASAKITDYSTKETNDFGETEFVEREFANELSYNLEIPIGNEDLVYNKLSATRAIPCVYDGNPDNAPRPLEMLRTFGTCDFEVLLKTHNGTFCSLEIRGLI